MDNDDALSSDSMICPECGSEMTPFFRGGITRPVHPKIDRWVCKCGYESKLKDGEK